MSQPRKKRCQTASSGQIKLQGRNQKGYNVGAAGVKGIPVGPFLASLRSGFASMLVAGARVDDTRTQGRTAHLSREAMV
jgi:hypothetical protein